MVFDMDRDVENKIAQVIKDENELYGVLFMIEKSGKEEDIKRAICNGGLDERMVYRILNGKC